MELNLSGIWEFQPDPLCKGEQAGLFDPAAATGEWVKVKVPGCFEDCLPGLDFYEGCGWFRTGFEVPGLSRDKRVVLRFEGVNYHAGVWLNGQYLGGNRNGFLPFEFEVQDTLIKEGTKILTVRADNISQDDDVPGRHLGWRNYGGIIREVALYTTDLLYAENPALTVDHTGHVRLSADIRNTLDFPARTQLCLKVLTSGGKTLARIMSEPIEVSARASTSAAAEGTVAPVQLWSPDTPVLYTAEVGLVSRDGFNRTKTISIGFRTITADGPQLKLNGKPVFLTGFNRHDDSPHTALARDLETARQDLEGMKQAGANFVRLCHYPHHPGLLDMCDKQGLLVMAEIPLYFWNDRDHGKTNQAARAATAEYQLSALIKRDRNHPSVVFWSVSNETPEGIPAVAADNRKLVRYARELDPDRWCVHVSNCWQTHPNFTEDDVVCINWYPGLAQAAGRENGLPEYTGLTKEWQAGMDKLHAQYPDKPILVTEFGYGSFFGSSGYSYGEDVQAKVLEAAFKGMAASYMCGAVVWCWADHPWPAGKFNNGLSVSPYGVMTRDREKKMAYKTASTFFKGKHGI